MCPSEIKWELLILPCGRRMDGERTHSLTCGDTLQLVCLPLELLFPAPLSAQVAFCGAGSLFFLYFEIPKVILGQQSTVFDILHNVFFSNIYELELLN